MHKDLTDEELVSLAVAGDSEAFGGIVTRWERKVYALCYGMLGHQEDAYDAAQETFISAFRNIAGFRGDAKVSSWLHRIAVNQCLTRMRRSKSRPEAFLEDALGTDGGALDIVGPSTSSPLAAAEENERRKLVRQALGALPPDLREVIVMKEFEDMTFQEISDVLGIPLSTVKSRLYTALKQMKMKLARTPVTVA
jgi:RNA polymerase sigma-70 factor (ECF subfamily)